MQRRKIRRRVKTSTPGKPRKPRYRVVKVDLEALYQKADDREFIYRAEIDALRENILLHREDYL